MLKRLLICADEITANQPMDLGKTSWPLITYFYKKNYGKTIWMREKLTHDICGVYTLHKHVLLHWLKNTKYWKIKIVLNIMIIQ